MKKKVKLQGSLRAYLCWPIYMTLIVIAMNVSMYIIDKTAGIVMSGFVVIYFIVAFLLYFLRRPNIAGDLIRYAQDYGQVQKQLLKELSVAYGILDVDGKILWVNNELADIVETKNPVNHNVTSIFSQITKDKLPGNEFDEVMHIEYNKANYKVVLRRVVTPDFDEQDFGTDIDVVNASKENTIIAMYLYDETENTILMKENRDQKLVVGLLYIDNYEEALESIDEVRRSLLIALVDRKINKYMQSIDAIIKKLEKDKYIIVFQQKYLQQLQNNKFVILEEVRGVNIGNDMSVTISIGIGVGADNYQRGYEYARAAIDLALGRGGDQAVIKDGERLYYYGGKSVQVEKNTRVKARVKAHALKEFVEGKSKVIVMGHSIGDVDCFGAAIGIYRIAKTLNKKAHIVINQVTTSVRPMMNRFVNNPEYEADMFLNSQQAKDIVDDNTLLVVVDVNRPSYTECPELLDMVRTIVILDHHRQTGEQIENAVLSYIEPYASSSCELVAEILQYIGEGLKLRQSEADAMYSGIMIDTDNFLTKTGVRTFEAAAYLKRCGADVTRIRKAFRTGMTEYRTKAEAISNVETYLDYYALAVCTSKGIDSPTVLCAQVANELMNVVNIKASFVFTEYNGKIYISARSIDEVNVQIVMEKLGGGGHISTAGAQFSDCTIEEAKKRLMKVLDTMTKEGDI